MHIAVCQFSIRLTVRTYVIFRRFYFWNAHLLLKSFWWESWLSFLTPMVPYPRLRQYVTLHLTHIAPPFTLHALTKENTRKLLQNLCVCTEDNPPKRVNYLPYIGTIIHYCMVYAFVRKIIHSIEWIISRTYAHPYNNFLIALHKHACALWLIVSLRYLMWNNGIKLKKANRINKWITISE